MQHILIFSHIDMYANTAFNDRELYITTVYFVVEHNNDTYYLMAISTVLETTCVEVYIFSDMY